MTRSSKGRRNRLASLLCAGWCATAVSVVNATADTAVAPRGSGPVDRFVAGLDSIAAMPAEARELIRTKWAQCEGCDPSEFLTQALAVMSPKFRDGLDAYDADEYERCAKAMGELRSDAEPFVATHAAMYEVKSLVALEQLVEAGERIRQLTGDGGARVAAYSYFAPEAAFLTGFCLLADLQYDAADEKLTRFLAEYPDAPPRLAIAARQMLLELNNREPGRMSEVADLMDYSGRRLKTADGGEVVQTRQQRIVQLLDQLIKEEEEKEKSSCNNPSSGAGGGKPQAGRSPAKPMQQSRLPGGTPQEESLRASRRANPGEMWGAMPPGERDRILQALRESFPSRYRQLVEPYYEQLAKQP
jgi:hypothetical protein